MRNKVKIDNGLALVTKYGIAINLVVLFVLTLSALPQLAPKMPNITTQVSYQNYIEHHLNQTDKNRQFKGYYEDLQYHNNFSSVLWQMEKNKLKKGDVYRIKMKKETSPLFYELFPNLDTIDKYETFTTNSWGMHDIEYPKTPAKNTIRIALVGSSNELGRGVRQHQVFEQLVEERLNKVHGTDSIRFEILNFSLPGVSTLMHQETVRKKVLAFQPSYILYFVHNRDYGNANYKSIIKYLLKKQTYQNNPQKYRDAIPWFTDFEQFLADEDIKLKAYTSAKQQDDIGRKILKWSFTNLDKITKGKNVKNVMVFNLSVLDMTSSYSEICALTADTSFQCLDLSFCYAPIKDRETLVLNAWDSHPNVKAHQLLANGLYKELLPLLGLNEVE